MLYFLAERQAVLPFRARLDRVSNNLRPDRERDSFKLIAGSDDKSSLHTERNIIIYNLGS